MVGRREVGETGHGVDAVGGVPQVRTRPVGRHGGVGVGAQQPGAGRGMAGQPVQDGAQAEVTQGTDPAAAQAGQT